MPEFKNMEELYNMLIEEMQNEINRRKSDQKSKPTHACDLADIGEYLAHNPAEMSALLGKARNYLDKRRAQKRLEHEVAELTMNRTELRKRISGLESEINKFRGELLTLYKSLKRVNEAIDTKKAQLNG